MMERIPCGIALRDAIREAEGLGFTVSRLNRTGELAFAHPSLPKPLKVNSRRKDVGRILVVALRRVAKDKGQN
jgi:hypothetical protein